VVVDLFHADGRTDGGTDGHTDEHDEANFTSRYFAKAPKNPLWMASLILTETFAWCNN